MLNKLEFYLDCASISRMMASSASLRTIPVGLLPRPLESWPENLPGYPEFIKHLSGNKYIKQLTAVISSILQFIVVK